MSFVAVPPETDVLTLKNGDSLIVRKRLNRGEEAAMFGHMSKGDMDPQLAVAIAFLVDWNIPGMPIRDADEVKRVSVINALDPDDFDEIYQLIAKHRDDVQKERDAAKKNRDGGSESSATLPSAPVLAGPTNT